MPKLTLGIIRESSGLVTKFVPILLLLLSVSVGARELTLEQAVDIALNRTMRGEMIEGNLEVAEQLYSARRINMYLPEISINGSVPSYRQSQDYRPYNSPNDRELFETRNLDFSSYIEMKQTLLTGGTLTATADLKSQDERRPDTRFDPPHDFVVDQFSKRGSFSFSLEQPLFRPSSVKNDLNNRKDDLEIARVTRREDEAALRKEITEAYLGVLQQTLKHRIASDNVEKARLQEGIDSIKLADGVLSEEDFLLSGSSRLDAELEYHAVETELGERKRDLAMLLDLNVSDPLDLTEPAVANHLGEATKEHYIAGWEDAAPIKKAERLYSKSRREADYAAAGHGLTGDLTASYSLGRTEIESEKIFVESLRDQGGVIQEDIPTSNWTVGLQFRLPLWDGGAGSAAVRAARYKAEQARYEFTRAQRSAQAKIVNLINQLDVSFQRLDIIRKQIGLAENRLAIAEGRHADGRISRLTLLEAEVFLLETRDRYFEELKKYLLNRIELDSQYLS
jgi:outer membrane protein TolC